MKTKLISRFGPNFLSYSSLYLILIAVLAYGLLIPSSVWINTLSTKPLILIYAVTATALLQIFNKKDKFVFNQVDIIFLGFIFWNFMSYFWATNASLIWDKSFVWLFLYVLYKTVATTPIHQLNSKIFIDILGLTLVFNLMVLGWFYWNISTQGDTFGFNYLQLEGIIPYLGYNANYVGALLALTFPLYLLWWHYRAKWKFFILSLAFLHLLFLFGLNCRGAMVAVVIQGVLFSIMNLKHLKKLFWVLPLGLLLFIAASFFIQDQQLFYKKYNPLAGISEGHDERLIMWESSIQVWKENIWAGKGTGNWIIEAPKYPLNLFFGYDDIVYYQHPHNIYFHLLSELGIVGLLLYLVLIFYFLYLYFKKIKTSDNKPIYQTLFFILVGYLVVSSFFGIVYSEKFYPVFHQVFLFLSLGLGAALHQDVPKNTIFALPAKIFTLVCAGLYLGYFYFCLNKQDLQYRFMALKNEGAYDQALEVFEDLYNPRYCTIFHQSNANTALKTHQALIFWSQGKKEAAINAMFEAVKDQPNYHINWFHFGNMYYELQDYENAKICFQNVYHLRDNFVKAKISLVEINLALNNKSEAEKWLDLANTQVHELIRRSDQTADENKSELAKITYNTFKQYEQQLEKIKEKLEQL